MFENESYVVPSNKRVTISVKGKGSITGKKTQKPTGHEAYLKALEQSKAKVAVERVDVEEIISGVIKTSDKFTISIRQDNGIDRVVFKHAIASFWALTPPPSSEETEQSEGRQ